MDLTTFEPRKILVCQLRQIGDVILSTPVVSLLAKRYPNAEIHVMTESKCALVLEENPYVTRVWSIDKKALKPITKEFAYYREIASQNFDIIVDLQQLPRIRWMLLFALCKTPVRMTFTPPWYTRWMYTHWMPPIKAYASAIKAEILKPLGITWNEERPLIVLRDEERQAAKTELAALGLLPEHTLVAVDATHRRITRQWPTEHYAKLLSLAAKERPDLRYQILYGPGEEGIVEELVALSDCPQNFLPKGKQSSLREMFAFVAEARLLIGNCSSPRHVAVAVGTPSISIQGSTSTGWVFPSPEHGYAYLGLPCQPCKKNTCSIGMPCLTDLTPEMVLPDFLNRLP